MIKTLIFDFGDVFLNLDKVTSQQELKQLGLAQFSNPMTEHNRRYEKGLISTSDFIQFYKEELPNTSTQQLVKAWNALLQDLPLHRLEFIENLAHSNQYRLILLSNTNALHIEWVQNHISVFDRFRNCFDQFYLSYKLYLRKPDREIYNFVLQENALNPAETLFIDDTFENIETAQRLGLHTWHLNPKTQDITELFAVKADLF